jgi:competence CoiA-like predicted nuclease
MLSARNPFGDVLAFEVGLEDGPFACPHCGAKVILKKGRRVIPHFAHLVRSNCAYSGEAESEEHKQAKKEIYEALLCIPGVTSVQMERDLQEVQPDVYCVINGEEVVLEIQTSRTTLDRIDEKTDIYARKNIAVLWMPVLSNRVLDDRYAPKDWELHLHKMYKRRVYYWDKGLILQPIEYQVYRLAPSLYAGERPSKRYVSPSLLLPVLIPDLAPIWQNRWGKYPRAKLWCEPWDKR